MPQEMVPLARIFPDRRAMAISPTTTVRPGLTPRQKAAVIVRHLLSDGSTLPIATLPEHMQAALAEQMGKMRLIDRVTLDAVVAEFLLELESVGLAFPGGIEGALSMMDGHISQSAASRIRRLASTSSKVDPWERITALPTDRLLPILTDEAVEVGAVMLSKLPVPKAAELLGRLPGERARRIAYAVSLTGNTEPETVRRIGAALLAELDNQPIRAFEAGPVERVGAILNVSPSLTRDDVLEGLDSDDAAFAAEVRRAIFTFTHIPARLPPRDAPKVTRIVDQQVLVTALAAAEAKPDLADAVNFLLDNISQRLAQGLREEMTARGKVRDKDGETAMNTVVMAIRQLEAAGELTLLQPDSD